MVIVVGMFSLLRQMERWLHQHIFKVGWLITKNYQTTTVLYYTFFLPGVVLHELVYWLAAGVLNLRADRAITFPEKQEIGELRLNFIRLSKKATPLQTAIISLAPPLVGLLVIWWIASNIFDFQAVLATMSSGELDAVAAGLRQLVAVQDFSLWFYFAFTISNTMMPMRGALQGLRPVLSALGIGAVVLLIAGLADDIGAAVIDPLTEGLNGLSTILLVIILVDVVGIAVLALIENSIEWVTGDSVTFKNGKMVGIRRSELLEQRKAEREKALRQQKAARQPAALPAGPPTVYRMALPVPAYGGIAISQLPQAIVEHDAPEALPERSPRDAPSVIPGEVAAAAAAPVVSMPLFNPGRVRDETPPDDGEPDDSSEADASDAAAAVDDADGGEDDGDVDDDELIYEDIDDAADFPDDDEEDDDAVYDDLYDDDYDDGDGDDEADDDGD